MNHKSLDIINDPQFYQYTTLKDLELMNTSELTIHLSIIRKEQRRLKEKCYQRGHIKKSSADSLDFNNLADVNKTRERIESLLFEKQGYIPQTITQKMIDNLISLNKKTVKKLNDKC